MRRRGDKDGPHVRSRNSGVGVDFIDDVSNFLLPSKVALVA
jgi:hypothetical protein